MLDPEQYYLLEEFCQSENIPVPHPEYSYVVAAIDLDLGKVVGIVAAQIQVHTEPMWLKKEYQGEGLWQAMADKMEGYLDFRSAQGGADIHVWCQPTNAAAERICRMRGFQKCDKPLYTKVYNGAKLVELMNDLTERKE